MHTCFNCHKSLSTRQGLRAHIQNRRACRTAWRVRIAAQNVRIYDPEDPDAHPRDDEPHSDWEGTGLGMGLEDLRDEDSPRRPRSPSLDLQDDRPAQTAHKGANDAQSHRRTRVEEVPDEDEAGDMTVIDEFPKPAATAQGQGKTSFERILEENRAQGRGHFYPFDDEEEWELAETLMTSGMSQGQMDKLLRLPIVKGLVLTLFTHILTC